MVSVARILAFLIFAAFSGAMIFSIHASLIETGWADAVGKKFDPSKTSFVGIKELDSFLFVLQNFFTQISGPLGGITLAVLNPLMLQFFVLIMVDSSRAHAYYPLYPFMGLVVHAGAAGLATPFAFALYVLATGKPKSGSAGVSLTSAVFSFIFTIFSLALIQLFPVGSATFEKAIIVLIVVQVVGPLAAFILNQFGRAESASQRLAGASLSILTVGVTIANGIQTWYPALYSLFETYLPSALEISNYTSFPPTLPSQVALLKAGTQIVADAKASPVLLFLVADAILVFFSFTVFAAVELGLFDAIRGVFYAIFFSPAAATAFWLSKRQAKFYEAELDLAKKVATGKKN